LLLSFIFKLIYSPSLKKLERGPGSFVAIDFETANENISSACALGLVRVKDDIITDEKYWLIKFPDPELYFRPFNSRLHGITREDVEDKPEFVEIWPEVRDFLAGNLVLAHNASFDLAVLKSLLDIYGLEYPELKYGCTVRISRKCWPKLVNHRLNTISDYLNISLKHHDPLEDARACAIIAIEANRYKNVRSIYELCRKIELELADFYDSCN